MKKVIAVLSAVLLAGACAFAEGYISANDVEKGVIDSSVAQEDGFFLNGVPEKALEVNGASVTVGEDTFTQRFKFGSKPKDGDWKAPSVSFPAKKGETVTVWGQSSSKTDARVVQIKDESGKVVKELPVNSSSDPCEPQSFKVEADGTFYAVSKSGTVYIYQIKVGK